MAEKDALNKSALQFVILMGLVSLCADMVYEGARSITGPFLFSLGASAFTVGFVAGFGELIGYTLRILSGYISDKTKQYWLITIVGYFVNLIAVPCMAFAGHWSVAAMLMLTERLGKAIRTPARDAMLSHATKRIGTGWGFGLHEALDQIGAVSGPLIVATVFFFRGQYAYHTAFLILGIPVLLALSLVILSRILYANPLGFESKNIDLASKGLGQVYWLYLLAAAFIGLAYADFPLLAYHMKKMSLFTDAMIPFLYALAMGVDGIAALIFGKLFDRYGIPILGVAIMCSMFFAPFVFLGNAVMMIVGVMLWGIGMGAQESIMRSGIAELVSRDLRGSAYGIFNTGFGVAWFIGSALMGYFYDKNILLLVVFSLFFQFLSIPVFFMIRTINMQVKK